MKSYDPSKPIISIHIPKCAGSSFSKILEAWFKEKLLRHYHDEKQNKPPIKHRLYSDLVEKKFRPGLCIHGHFNSERGNGVRDYYPEVDQLISIIRDPFDLHLSTYFFVRRADKDQGAGAYRSGKKHRIIEEGWNIEDYLREVKKSYICNFLPTDITLDNYQEIIENQFLYIGISENLQNSVDILAQMLGFSTIAVPQVNVSEWNEPIPDGAREEFEENNPLETAIYRYVKNSWGNNPIEIEAIAPQGALMEDNALRRRALSLARRGADRYLPKYD